MEYTGNNTKFKIGNSEMIYGRGNIKLFLKEEILLGRNWKKAGNTLQAEGEF